MSWQPRARAAAQAVGLDPRYVRRLRWISKARAIRSVGASLRSNRRFVLLDPESANFTYELANPDELVQWVAGVTSSDPADVEVVVREGQGDAALAERLHHATAGKWLWTKRCPPFGKRLGWYAIARLLKPELIVESGVHDGLGSMVLLRALEQNDRGRLVSFDVNPAAGWLVGRHPRWELRIESSRAGLHRVVRPAVPVGMFIHDSLHTYENERFELGFAAAHLAAGGVLISDNAHGTSAFADTCAEAGLESAVFHERSRGHFYPGGAIGAAWQRPITRSGA